MQSVNFKCSSCPYCLNRKNLIQCLTYQFTNFKLTHVAVVAKPFLVRLIDFPLGTKSDEAIKKVLEKIHILLNIIFIRLYRL
jgi:hypothetical protein